MIEIFVMKFLKILKTNFITKDLQWFSETQRCDFQRQRCTKDVPKTEALREDVWDTDYKDKDAKDKLDVFLM